MYAQFWAYQQALIPCEGYFDTVPAFIKTSMIERALISRVERKAEEVLELLKQTGNDWDTCAWQVLLTGFGFKLNAEPMRMLAQALPRVDVVMAPHHGSASSSGRELVEASAAGHAIAQAGHLNRFRHPARAVELRWTRAGAAFWRSDRDGAVMASSGAEGLEVWAERERGRRYWHGR